jgi:predicted chitinase
MPEVYKGIPTQEEPEPNIDMSVLQEAMMPEPITVEELPEGLMSPRFDTKGGEVAGATTKAYNFLIKAGLNPPENQLLSEKLTVTGDQFTNREDALEFINDSLDFEPTRKAAFSATVDAESSSGLLEGTNYSKQGAIATLGGGDANRIARIEALYGRNNRLSPEDQETLFNIAYGGRMGNAPDEGHKYRGRGLIQITGKDNYRKYGEAIGIGDALVNNPDILLNNPSVMLAITEAYLQDRLPERADGLSANDLKDAIGHSGAVPRGVTWNGTGSAYKGNQRWMDVIARLEEAGKQEEADEARLNNEFTAQQRAGAFIDGDIGPGSIRSMREFLIANGVTIPEDASARELVRLVNGVQ